MLGCITYRVDPILFQNILDQQFIVQTRLCWTGTRINLQPHYDTVKTDQPDLGHLNWVVQEKQQIIITLILIFYRPIPQKYISFCTHSQLCRAASNTQQMLTFRWSPKQFVVLQFIIKQGVKLYNDSFKHFGFFIIASFVLAFKTGFLYILIQVIYFQKIWEFFSSHSIKLVINEAYRKFLWKNEQNDVDQFFMF